MKINTKKTTSVLLSGLLTMLLLTCSCAVGPKTSQPLFFEFTQGTYNIPEGHETYTLFFATSSNYVEEQSKREQRQLKKHIKAFGKSIGDNNLAVWAREPDKDTLNPQLGQDYADDLSSWHAIKLNYSYGPYLVFMTHHPDTPPDANDFAVAISFSDKNSKQVVEAIEYLEAQIRRGNVSKYKVMAVDFWLDLKSFLENNKANIKKIIIRGE